MKDDHRGYTLENLECLKCNSKEFQSEKNLIEHYSLFLKISLN